VGSVSWLAIYYESIYWYIMVGGVSSPFSSVGGIILKFWIRHLLFCLRYFHISHCPSTRTRLCPRVVHASALSPSASFYSVTLRYIFKTTLQLLVCSIKLSGKPSINFIQAYISLVLLSIQYITTCFDPYTGHPQVLFVLDGQYLH
jgi:hypothetical protein